MDERNRRFHVMTVFHVGAECNPNSKCKTEVFLLNPGECFQRFGGSSQGLVVQKTASLITSYYDPAGCRKDYEVPLNLPEVKPGRKDQPPAPNMAGLKVWQHLAARIGAGDRVIGPVLLASEPPDAEG